MNTWQIRLDKNQQAWRLEHAGICRLRIPLGGAWPYRGGAVHLTDVDSRTEGMRSIAEGAVHMSLESDVVIFVRDMVCLDNNTLTLHRSWWHEESRIVSGLELAIEAQPDGRMEEHLVPGCLYDGNRESSPERLVPRLAGTTLFEEHKCPTPMIYAGCRGQDDVRFGVVFSPAPCAVVDGHLPDQWWSLGFSARDEGFSLLSVSGRLALNGEDERIYNAQNQMSPYPDAWVDACPRQVYEKHIRIELQAERPVTWGWRKPLRQAIAAQPPLTAAEDRLISNPALEDAIRLKVGYALRRWYEDEECAGMTWYPQRPEFAALRRSVEYGWVGQNMRLGLALWRWGRHCGDTGLVRRGERCAEAWVRVAAAACTEGRVSPTHYVVGTGWRDTLRGDDGYMRPTVETLFELAEFCRLRREVGDPAENWERTLHKALEFYTQPGCFDPDGLWPLKWNREGLAQPGPTVTAGVLMVAAMVETAALPGKACWLDHALEYWTRYAAVFLGDAPRHPCGSALDSSCEDMDSGMFLLTATVRLAEGLRRAGRPVEEQLLDQAMQAADWVLSWIYTWDVPMLPGTFLASTGFGMQGRGESASCCHSASSGALDVGIGRFSTVGLSDMSIQNRHVHVYSPIAEILRFSNELKGEAGALYAEQARRMLVPIINTIARPGCRWGMDEDGEQTEQYNQTNYVQHPWDSVCRPRGGIARWFVPWITAWVLSICLDALDFMQPSTTNKL